MNCVRKRQLQEKYLHGAKRQTAASHLLLFFKFAFAENFMGTLLAV